MADEEKPSTLSRVQLLVRCLSDLEEVLEQDFKNFKATPDDEDLRETLQKRARYAHAVSFLIAKMMCTPSEIGVKQNENRPASNRNPTSTFKHQEVAPTQNLRQRPPEPSQPVLRIDLATEHRTNSDVRVIENTPANSTKPRRKVRPRRHLRNS